MIDRSWDLRKTGPRGATRHLVVENVPWRVFEYVEGSDHPKQVSLMFACDAAWRRLRVFPPNWAACDDATLFALSCPAPCR